MHERSLKSKTGKRCREFASDKAGLPYSSGNNTTGIHKSIHGTVKLFVDLLLKEIKGIALQLQRIDKILR
ncbi:MAG: hypothetical protein ACK6C4_08540, partial [Bacteroidota bacterium]